MMMPLERVQNLLTLLEAVELFLLEQQRMRIEKQTIITRNPFLSTREEYDIIP